MSIFWHGSPKKPKKLIFDVSPPLFSDTNTVMSDTNWYRTKVKGMSTPRYSSSGFSVMTSVGFPSSASSKPISVELMNSFTVVGADSTLGHFIFSPEILTADLNGRRTKSCSSASLSQNRSSQSLRKFTCGALSSSFKHEVFSYNELAICTWCFCIIAMVNGSVGGL